MTVLMRTHMRAHTQMPYVQYAKQRKPKCVRVMYYAHTHACAYTYARANDGQHS